MTGRVDKVWRIYEKIAKKLKYKSQLQFCDFILTFVPFYKKCARVN